MDREGGLYSKKMERRTRKLFFATFKIGFFSTFSRFTYLYLFLAKNFVLQSNTLNGGFFHSDPSRCRGFSLPFPFFPSSPLPLFTHRQMNRLKAALPTFGSTSTNSTDSNAQEDCPISRDRVNLIESNQLVVKQIHSSLLPFYKGVAKTRSNPLRQGLDIKLKAEERFSCEWLGDTLNKCSEDIQAINGHDTQYSESLSLSPLFKLNDTLKLRRAIIRFDTRFGRRRSFGIRQPHEIVRRFITTRLDRDPRGEIGGFQTV